MLESVSVDRTRFLKGAYLPQYSKNKTTLYDFLIDILIDISILSALVLGIVADASPCS